MSRGGLGIRLSIDEYCRLMISAVQQKSGETMACFGRFVRTVGWANDSLRSSGA